MLKLTVFNVNKVLHIKNMSDQRVGVIILHRCHHLLLPPLIWRPSILDFKLERTASSQEFVPGTAIQAGLSTARASAKRNMLEQYVVKSGSTYCNP